MKFRKLLLVAAVAATTITTNAQSLFVKQTDGTVHEYAVDKVQEVLFGASTANADTRTVTYHVNDGSDATFAQSAQFGSLVSIDKGATLSREGYTLVGWNTEADASGAICALGTLLPLTADLTLYAQWRKVEKPAMERRTITYAINDGSGTMRITEFYKGVVVSVAKGIDCKRAGYEMTGWATAADGSGVLFASGTSVLFDHDLTLYAQWQKLEGQGTEGGHQWIDLGLPSGTMWATCNLGASAPEGSGDFFAWGEVEAKDEFTPDNYVHKHTADYKASYVGEPEAGAEATHATLKPEHDAAHMLWGGRWQIPTPKQCEELISKCQWKWITRGGVAGFEVEGPSGKSIFLPAAGGKQGSVTQYQGTYGDFWTNKFDVDNDTNAHYMVAGKPGNAGIVKKVGTIQRSVGRTIRPVMVP